MARQENKAAMVAAVEQSGLQRTAYSLAEFAGLIGVNYRTARRMVLAGQVGHFPAGGEYRIPAAEIERLTTEACARRTG